MMISSIKALRRLKGNHFLPNLIASGLTVLFLTHSVLTTSANDFVPTALTLSQEDAYIGEIKKWRGERLKEVNGEEGWTTLVGLFWLNQGKNRFGSNPSNEIVLPRNRSPRLAGSLNLSKGIIHLNANPAATITSDGAPANNIDLQTDVDGKPTVLKMGSLTLFVIKRGDRLGLRVKDKQHPARTRFAGLDYFPIDLNWKIDARFEPYNPPKNIPIVTVLGMVETMTSPGALVFEVNGITYSLDPVLEQGSKQLFIIFADRTTGKQTYGAGRYLYADPPDSAGKVIVDFNKAYNPPCAFTRFATCPLPPRQNRLALLLQTGEKKYRGSGH